jgi:hypothetical protein
MNSNKKVNKAVTQWSNPNEVVDSQYGKIVYNEWCTKERDRINQRGDTVAVVTREDGCIALSR